MKNRYFAALALAGLVSFAACGGDDEALEGEGEIVTDTTTVAPITPEPVVTDTTGLLPVDSAAVSADSAAGL